MLYSPSNQLNKIFHGLAKAQILPIRATPIAMPTHQIIHIKVGLKFSNGLECPPKPVDITSPSSSTDSSFTVNRVRRDVNIILDQDGPIKFMRGYDV